MGEFTTKDSGARAEFASGMKRDTEEGKARFDLLKPKDVPYAEQMLTRVAELMARGAEKYDARNWEKANSQDELDRYYSSGERHFHQWQTGETDEDHAAAVIFNIIAAETVKYKMRQQAGKSSDPSIHIDGASGGVFRDGPVPGSTYVINNTVGVTDAIAAAERRMTAGG